MRLRRSLLLLFALQLPWSAGLAAKGEERTFQNPILPGFHPDPSICRVGEDYYLVNSSFEWFPGVPIYHSKDLVHWELIGHALARPSNLDLDGVECSGGIYAPTLRYHDHRFYLITTLIGSPHHSGNFIVTAEDPRGPWSDPHWIAGAEGIDPSLFFDDDQAVYYCGNGRPLNPVSEKHRLIWVRQLDLAHWSLTGPRGVLDSAEYFANGKLGPVNNFEGPHLYKKDGRYYLMLSHGGTSQHHAVSIWSSDRPLGPFTQADPANPIVTHRGDHPDGITCTGHADLVQTQTGDWWMVLLGVRSNSGHTNMGRESFLVPVDWTGTWPIVNPQGRVGRVEPQLPAPRLPEAPLALASRDDFSEAVLGPRWTWIRTPRSTWWSLTAKPGWLTIDLRPEQIFEPANPSFIGVRQENSRCEVSTRMSFEPKGEKECAGLAALRARDGVIQIVVENHQGVRCVCAYLNTQLAGSHPLPASPVDLRIALDGPHVNLDYAAAPGHWTTLAQVDGSLLATAPGGRFTGTFLGVYASSRGAETAGTAAFDWFDYRNL